MIEIDQVISIDIGVYVFYMSLQRSSCHNVMNIYIYIYTYIYMTSLIDARILLINHTYVFIVTRISNSTSSYLMIEIDEVISIDTGVYVFYMSLQRSSCRNVMNIYIYIYIYI